MVSGGEDVVVLVVVVEVVRVLVIVVQVLVMIVGIVIIGVGVVVMVLRLVVMVVGGVNYGGGGGSYSGGGSNYGGVVGTVSDGGCTLPPLGPPPQDTWAPLHLLCPLWGQAGQACFAPQPGKEECMQ